MWSIELYHQWKILFNEHTTSNLFILWKPFLKSSLKNVRRGSRHWLHTFITIEFGYLFRKRVQTVGSLGLSVIYTFERDRRRIIVKSVLRIRYIVFTNVPFWIKGKLAPKYGLVCMLYVHSTLGAHTDQTDGMSIMFMQMRHPLLSPVIAYPRRWRQGCAC